LRSGERFAAEKSFIAAEMRFSKRL